MKYNENDNAKNSTSISTQSSQPIKSPYRKIITTTASINNIVGIWGAKKL